MQAEATPRIHSSERGTGAPIVLIHGFGATHRVWDSLISSLPRQARTIAYDLPGHGLSLETPGAGSAKFAAKSILADLARRGIEAAHVVGHSMGGAVATLMALTDPHRVASLTLLAPGGFGPEINGMLLRRYAQAASSDEIRVSLAAMSGKDATVSDETLRPYLDMRSRTGQTEKLLEIASAISRDDRQGVIPMELLADLTMPITVLWGTDDPVLPFAQTASLPASFTLREIPRAGHMLIGEVPALVRETILASLAPSG